MRLGSSYKPLQPAARDKGAQWPTKEISREDWIGLEIYLLPVDEEGVSMYGDAGGCEEFVGDALLGCDTCDDAGKMSLLAILIISSDSIEVHGRVRQRGESRVYGERKMRIYNRVTHLTELYGRYHLIAYGRAEGLGKGYPGRAAVRCILLCWDRNLSLRWW